MGETILRTITLEELPNLVSKPIDPETLTQARAVVEDVKKNGEQAVIEHAQRLGDLKPGEKLVRERADLEDALRALPESTRELLRRIAGRIKAFASSQLQSLSEIQVELPGGFAGHSLKPVQSAGCYAPGGRYPLPSSVLMTVTTARVAGVEEVWVASPHPSEITLAAAAVAGADALLTVGGAHAIAALAYGAGQVPSCHVIVGPGNRWVTAAKWLVSERTSIDMLAGPTELVVLADTSANPKAVAADLLAQAEHDVDSLPVLVALDKALVSAVRNEIEKQLEYLPDAASALRNGFSVIVSNLQSAVDACDLIAPEHLQLCIEDAQKYSKAFSHCGALFIGPHSTEVLCDYGAGPNHVLPTGGTSRARGGLSVFDFLRIRTWMRISDPEAAAELAEDAARLARIEGLEAHARAAELRRG